MTQNRKLSEEQWEQVRILYEVGVTPKQLADDFGVSFQRIYQKAKVSNWAVRLDAELCDLLKNRHVENSMALLRTLKDRKANENRSQIDTKAELVAIEDLGPEGYYQHTLRTRLTEVVHVEAVHANEWNAVGNILALAEQKRVDPERIAEAENERLRADHQPGDVLPERVLPDQGEAVFLVRYAKEFASVVTMKQQGERKLYRMDLEPAKKPDELPFDFTNLDDHEIESLRQIASKVAG